MREPQRLYLIAYTEAHLHHTYPHTMTGIIRNHPQSQTILAIADTSHLALKLSFEFGGFLLLLFLFGFLFSDLKGRDGEGGRDRPYI